MGERKGTNKYYPPDFDPAKHGSLNRYHHSHPLRERARKLAQGILIIRFEMPYNVWCEGCKNHIGMGVRYNAEKRKVGTYYTTPIYRFRMKCHLCVNHIELQTDPATCQYLIVSGARRKEERWDMGDNQQVLPTAPEQQERLLGDPMFRLEHGVMDRGVLARATPSLVALQRAQGAWRDDFGLNSRLRQRFREEKQSLREEEEEAARLKAKGGLSIPLLREEEEDRRLAALLSLRTPHSYEEKQRLKRSEISARPWFPPPQQQQQQKPGGGGSTPRPTGGRGWQGKTPHPPLPSSTPPASAPPTPARWGIVRRRSGEEPGRGGAEKKGETPTPQPPPREEEGGGDPLPAQPPPLPSLVADYSDSGSDSP